MWLIQLTTMNPLNYFQIQPNSRGLMHRPDWVLSNPTFKSYITETKFQKSINKSYQKNTKVARAHWLSEVHKSFKRVPSFWPIIGSQFLTLQCWKRYKATKPSHTKQMLIERHFWDAAEHIKKIPKELIRNEEYTLILFYHFYI